MLQNKWIVLHEAFFKIVDLLEKCESEAQVAYYYTLGVEVTIPQKQNLSVETLVEGRVKNVYIAYL